MKNLVNKLFLFTIICLNIFITNQISCICGSACDCQTCSCQCVCDSCYDNITPCLCGQISPCKGAQFMQYRSASLNKAKEICGWQPYINRYGMEKINGSLYSSIEFTSSFKPLCIAQYLFGDDLVDGKNLIIQGSAVENRHPKAWLADYFGLPIDFESTVQFHPSITNCIVDLNLYCGLDRVAKGLFLKVHLPVVSTTWALNMSECVKVKGQESFPLGYMSIGAKPYKPSDTGSGPTPILRSNLPEDFIDAVQPGTTFGDQRVSMYFGSMPCVKLQTAQFSDFHFTFGYNFLLKQDYNFGAGLYVVCPTGTRPDSRYLFEPLVGNGKHWEFGTELNGSWIFYRSKENENRHAGIWFDATLTNMVNAYQARSFDFCNKPNSRYMLLLQMTKATDLTGWDPVGLTTTSVKDFSGYAGADIIPANPLGQTVSPKIGNFTYAQYTNSSQNDVWSGLIPAINYTTRVVNVSVDLQADIAIKFGYIGQDFSFDIGYELWARTREKIKPCQAFAKNQPDDNYVIKGDGLIWAKDYNSDTYYSTLSGSQCCADIHSGQNMKLKTTDPAAAQINGGVDNAQYAWVLNYPGNRTFTNNTFVAQVNENENQVYSSFDPKLVSVCDIDTCQSAPALTNKIFAHINYEWKDKDSEWRPFAGIGAEAEFAPKNRHFRAISQWGAWLKAGVAFK